MGLPSGHGQVTWFVMGRWRLIGRPSWGNVLYARSSRVSMDFCRRGVASTVSGYSDSSLQKVSQAARVERTRLQVLSVPPTVVLALAVAAIAFAICHFVMEVEATARAVSVKKRTWKCMHAVGEALHKRVTGNTRLHTMAQA